MGVLTRSSQDIGLISWSDLVLRLHQSSHNETASISWGAKYPYTWIPNWGIPPMTPENNDHKLEQVCILLHCPYLVAPPLPVGAAYERVHKRTFLAMSILVAIQIPILLMLILLYRTLGRLRKQQIHVNATKPLPFTKHGSDSSTSDEKDATEVSDLLTSE